jgi:hypothetical protein
MQPFLELSPVSDTGRLQEALAEKNASQCYFVCRKVVLQVCSVDLERVCRSDYFKDANQIDSKLKSMVTGWGR